MGAAGVARVRAGADAAPQGGMQAGWRSKTLVADMSYEGVAAHRGGKGRMGAAVGVAGVRAGSGCCAPGEYASRVAQ